MNGKTPSIKAANINDNKMKYYFFILLSFLLFSCKYTSKFIQCDNCNGDGDVLIECEDCNGYGYLMCRMCEGSGEVECDYCYGRGREGYCLLCSGSGYSYDGFSCLSCNGTGKKECFSCNGNGDIECEDCNGCGNLRCGACEGAGEVTIECPDCEGRGRIFFKR